MNVMRSARRVAMVTGSRSSLAGLLALAVVGLAPAFASARSAEELPLAYSMEGNYLAARFANRIFDYKSSADYFAEALVSEPEDPFLLERTLSLFLAAGETSVVRDYAERLRDVDRGNPLAGLSLGVDDFRKGRWAVAVEELKTAKSGPLLTLAAEVLSAWCEQGAGKAPIAIQRLDKLTGEKWFDFFRNYHSGLIASVSGDDKLAADYFRKTLAIDDSSVVTVDAAVRTMARAGDRDGAGKVLAKAIGSGNPHPLLAALKADLDSGRKVPPHIRTTQQGAAEILSGLGAAIVRDGSNDMGMIFLQLALAIDPGADLTRIALAENFEREERYEDAIAVLAAVSANSPMKRNAEIMIAFDYNSLDKPEEAVAALQKVIRRSPHDKEALTSLGNIQRVHKKYDEAIKAYTKAIDGLKGKIAVEDWQLFYNRGIAYERSDKWPLAEADFRKALELKPNQPLVLNYLGYSWIDKGMHLDEGMAMIRKAVDQNPTDGFIIDSLGWAHYRLGQYEEAVRELERAVDLQAGDSTVNDHLGDAYWRVGRRLEARFQWNHAIAGKPDAELQAKIEAKLKDGLTDEPPKAAAEATPANTAK